MRRPKNPRNTSLAELTRSWNAGSPTSRNDSCRRSKPTASARSPAGSSNIGPEICPSKEYTSVVDSRNVFTSKVSASSLLFGLLADE